MLRQSYFSQLLLFFLLLLTLSCSDSKPERLLLGFSDDFNTTAIGFNRNLQINVYAEFDDASQESVTSDMLWCSSDESIATVEDGLISTNAKNGKVEISYRTDVESGNEGYFEMSYSIEVKALELLSISLSKSSITLSEGESYALEAEGRFEDNETAEISYQDITKDCEWSSADSKISTVDNGEKKGLVRAKKIGFTTIRASHLGLSVTASVEVEELRYTQIEIDAPATTLDVQQSITLEASALANDGSKIFLSSDEVEWSSSDAEIVAIEGSLAIAKSRGEATITATLKSDASLSDTLVLSVDKEEYVRLFKNGLEVAFPFAQSSEYDTLPSELDSFTLRAVGKDFVVENLLVSDFNLNLIESNYAGFDGVSSGERLLKDTNLTFTLVHVGAYKELNYSFTMDDAFKNKFSQKYKALK